MEEKRTKSDRQLEGQVKIICEQLEVQKKNTYADLSKWLKNGTKTVPTWMSKNGEFVKGLKNVRNVHEYVALIKRFGRQFIVNQAQCASILNQNETTDEERREVVKIITKFWSESTTRTFLQKENWDGQLELTSTLIQADDHPINYELDRQNPQN